MVDVVELLTHWYAGRSQHVMADSLGLDRKTIRKYIQPAKEAGFVPGGPPVGEQVWAGWASEWFPNLIEGKVRSSSWPAIVVHHDRIADWLAAEVSLATVHQRLRDEHGLTVSESSLRRYVAENMAAEATRASVTVLREDPPPGAEAQVDYGLLGRWYDPVAARWRRVWAFVLVLAASRHMFVRPVLLMDQRTWTQCHVAAFEFFGGVPARIVLDNLATGVTKADLYDPKLNRAYAELAAHYGVLLDPARARKPKDKPRCERMVPYVRGSFWRGREFLTYPAMVAEAARWCDQVAGVRACRPLGGAGPKTVFDATEASALAQLPAAPFELATWSRPKVGPDIHIKVGPTLYSVPWRLIGSHVDVRATEAIVQVFTDGTLVKTHVAAVGRRRVTDYADYPPEKIAFHMRTPIWCRNKAAEIGPATVAVVDQLLEVNALYRLRATQGVLGLADSQGPHRLEAACAKALTAGDAGYRTIKGILLAGTETDPTPSLPGPGAAVPAHLRGPHQLANPAELAVTTGHVDDVQGAAS
jgi:transposase